MIKQNKHKKKVPTKELVELYRQEFSCCKIAEMFSMTRQSVWERLKRNKIRLRTKKLLPFIVYNGLKFTISNTGYYRSTRRDKHTSLHRYKYEKEVCKIPKGYDIHHIDCNKLNNDIENLECLPKSEHTRLYSPHHNQYKNNETIRTGRYNNV